MSVEHKYGYTTEPSVSGKVLLDKARTLDLWVGYQYWLNKSGNNHNTVPGALAGTVFVGKRYPF